jgi:hypothetical protein
LFFVSVNSPDIRPVEFAHRIFTDPDFPQQAAHRCAVCRPFWLFVSGSYNQAHANYSDACHRLVPIERVCAASEADIVSAAQAMLPAHFPSEADAPLKVRRATARRVQPLFHDLSLSLSILFAVCSSQLCLTSATTIV